MRNLLWELTLGRDMKKQQMSGSTNIIWYALVLTAITVLCVIGSSPRTKDKVAGQETMVGMVVSDQTNLPVSDRKVETVTFTIEPKLSLEQASTNSVSK